MITVKIPITYASPIPPSCASLQEYLVNLRMEIRLPQVLFGDFNDILLPSEVLGGNLILSRARSFATMINRCCLMDLGLVCGHLTWVGTSRGVTP